MNTDPHATSQRELDEHLHQLRNDDKEEIQ